MNKLIKVKEVEDIEGAAIYVADWLIDVMQIDAIDLEEFYTDIVLILEDTLESIATIGIEDIFKVKCKEV